MNKTYRIKDIAELSGVSTGTVDRILHKRGKVSEEARIKVEKVLKKIDYHPNLIARSLALKKHYHLIAVIPSYAPGEYWDTVAQGLHKAEEEFFSYNVEIDYLYFNQYEKASFDKLIPEILDSDVQGVIIATQFHESVIDLTKKLDIRQIPYVLIDAYIEGTNSISYFGTNSYDSGYIAGRMLWGQINVDEDIVIFRLAREGEKQVTQVMKREEGFRKYLEEHCFEGKTRILTLTSNDPEKNNQLLDDFMTQNKDIRHGIIFNSRAHLVAHYFDSRHISFHLIGYDLIEKNVEYLEKGIISTLIAQRPEVQGVNAVRALFKHLILKEKMPLINYMPIDIMLKENIKYYNNYI